MARTRRGATLVEVLIAVGIIVVLAAIFSSVVCASAGRAKSASCLQNLGQIHAAMHLYAASADDMLPPVMRKESGKFVTDFSVMSGGLDAYGVMPATWKCPADRETRTERVTIDPFYEKVSFADTSFGIGVEAYNLPLGEAGKAFQGVCPPRALSSMKSDWPLVFERVWGRGGSADPSSMISAHGKAVNVLYVSGSTRRIPMSEWISVK